MACFPLRPPVHGCVAHTHSSFSAASRGGAGREGQAGRPGSHAGQPQVGVGTEGSSAVMQSAPLPHLTKAHIPTKPTDTALPPL